jgi:hypothetical protein
VYTFPELNFKFSHLRESPRARRAGHLNGWKSKKKNWKKINEIIGSEMETLPNTMLKVFCAICVEGQTRE